MWVLIVVVMSPMGPTPQLVGTFPSQEVCRQAQAKSIDAKTHKTVCVHYSNLQQELQRLRAPQ